MSFALKNMSFSIRSFFFCNVETSLSIERQFFEAAHLDFYTLVTSFPSACLCFHFPIVSPFTVLSLCSHCACVSERDRCDSCLHGSRNNSLGKTSHMVVERRCWQTSQFHVDWLRCMRRLLKELSAVVRQMAVYETNISTLTVRIDEMRDHLDQAGVRIHEALRTWGDTTSDASRRVGTRTRTWRWMFQLRRTMCKDNTSKDPFRDVKYARIWGYRLS